MTDLYTDKDLLAISAQLKKRYILLGCGLAVFLALFIFSMVIRLEWLSMVSVFLFCSLAVFVIEMFCLPLHRYKKLINAALTGRSHVETLEYKETEAETSVVDGVTCLGLIFLGAPDKHGTREQRFYWDREIPLPAFNPGDQVTLKYTGRNIIGYEI
jgi:hypothetical protein